MANVPFKRGDIVLYKGELYAVVQGAPGELSKTTYDDRLAVPINWVAGGYCYRHIHKGWDFSANPANLEKVTEMLDD